MNDAKIVELLEAILATLRKQTAGKPSTKRLLSLRSAAAILGVRREAVAEMVNARKIRAVHVKGRKHARIPAEEIDRLCAAPA